jgi:hypothetical protein
MNADYFKKSEADHHLSAEIPKFSLKKRVTA